MPKIVFMGTPDFSKISLQKIVEAGYEVKCVVTNPDRPKGRGMKMVPSPVKEYAMEIGLPIFQPEKVKGNIEFFEELKKIEPDIIIVVAYGKILPKEILEMPKLGCINLHASLLPKYRGAAPIQWSVLNGDKTTGVTTMYMDVGMDTGDMILTKEVEIGDDETTGELWDRLSVVGADLLVETIKQIIDGTAPRIKQGDNYTMAPMLDKKMAKIDWKNQNTEQIKNLVRGLNPIMGAYSYLGEKKIKFWKVKKCNAIEVDAGTLKPGTVIHADEKQGLFIKTIDGVLSVLELQAENSKRMNVFDFLRGNKIENFKIFM